MPGGRSFKKGTSSERRRYLKWSFHLLDLEGKADRTANGYKFICPVFWLDKTSLQQGLEKLSENRINGYSISNNTNIKVEWILKEYNRRKAKLLSIVFLYLYRFEYCNRLLVWYRAHRANLYRSWEILNEER